MKALESRSLWMVYIVMTMAGLSLDYFASGDAWLALRHSQLPSPTAIVMSIILGLVAIGGFYVFSRFFRWATVLNDLLRQILTPLSYLHAVLLAIIAAALEEWFFRGILLPRVGLVMSSALFAWAHLFVPRAIISWTAWYFILGLFLGVLARESGSLLPAFIAHGLFNLVFLVRLNHEAYRSASY